MTNTELLNAIDSRIASLLLNSENHRKAGSIKPDELYMCYSKEIAYQECRNIVLSVLGEDEEC